MGVAEVFSSSLYGESRATGCWRFDDVRGEAGAYLCERELVDGRVVTLLVGASTEMPPVLLHCLGLAPIRYAADQARSVAARALGCDSVVHSGSVYYSPLDLWLEYSTGDAAVMVSLRDLRPVEPRRVRSVEPVRYSDRRRTANIEQWQLYVRGVAPHGLDGQRWIEGVPDWDWHYGCAPTAAANVLDYWAERGFPLLVDSVSCGVRDPIEGDVDSVPNVSRELAVAMETDTLGNGSTAGGRIAPGIAAVCNASEWGNGYEFVSWLSWDNRDLLVAEIDSGRPGVLCLVGHPEYGSHTVTFCGWGPPDRDWIVVHDCWGGTARDIVLNYNYGCPVGVVPVVPPAPAAPRPADVALAALVRPAEDGRPGAMLPEVRIANLGGVDASCRAYFRVERPGGGIAETFGDSVVFPPAGWLRFGPGGDGGWERGGSDSTAQSGWAQCSPGLDVDGGTGDDWLVTPRVRVRPSDTLEFILAAAGAGRESVEVWVSTAEPSAGQCDSRVAALGCAGPGLVVCRASVGQFGDTVVSIAFRYSGGSNGLRLDDVRLEEVFYSESADVTVPVGEEAQVAFEPWDVPLGHYSAQCSLHFAGDEQAANDTASRAFVVCHRADEPTEAEPDRVAAAVRVSPTLVRGSALVDGWRGRAEVSVFDALGRSVLSGTFDGPGRLDCSRLAAGVYVLRARGESGQLAAARFVVAR